jgi:asparagine synthase (glutamine-hydrolysing)
MEHKINRRGGKQILRSLLPDFPGKMQKRKKKGFGSPIGAWLRTDFSHLLDNLPEALEAWIEPSILRKTIQEHLSGQIDHRRRLWTAIMLRDFLEQPKS